MDAQKTYSLINRYSAYRKERENMPLKQWLEVSRKISRLFNMYFSTQHPAYRAEQRIIGKTRPIVWVANKVVIAVVSDDYRANYEQAFSLARVLVAIADKFAGERDPYFNLIFNYILDAGGKSIVGGVENGYSLEVMVTPAQLRKALDAYTLDDPDFIYA